MKILFLHLSDLHIKNEAAIKSFQISKIADTLNAFSWGRMVIFISGDIAFSGERKQYGVAKRIIGQLIDDIKSRCGHSGWIDTICVPGNHDLNHDENPRTSMELQIINRSSAYLDNLDGEFEKQKHFFSFASKYNCFSDGKAWCRKILHYDGYNVEINLVNSAIFSILEEDKGLHYLPNQCISEIAEPSHADFVITIMHHSPEWYTDTQKNQIDETICGKSSLVMYGHEHYIARKTISYENGREAYIQAGGCLCQNDDWSRSSFHVGVFDTEKNTYEHRKFVWNDTQNQYESEALETIVLPKKPSEERNLQLTNSFQRFLHEDEKRDLADDFLKYFVFPRLETDEVQNGVREFTTESAFLDEIRRKKRVIISGGYNSGKTVLLKKLAIALQDDHMIIYCRLSDIRTRSVDRIIKYRFQETYGDSESDYNRFLQAPKDKKVLIIDDVDQIAKSDLERFIWSAGDFFEYIILATKQVIDLSLFERMKAQLKASDTIYTYKITPLYADKRLEVIKRVVELKSDDPSTIDKTVALLSEAITAQRNFISLDPDFVIKYVEYYCNNIGDASIGDSGVFSKVFEANITTAIGKYQTPRLSVDKVFVLLSKVAHFIHFNKAYPVTEKQISMIVDSYNQEYGATVKCSDFINNILNAKILVIDEQSDGYRFSNKNYLAYFVARELNRGYNETGEDTDLRAVLHSACFGINADILMFVSYITDNIRVLNLILSLAKSYTDDWKEFDYGNNLPEFFKAERVHSVALPAPNAEEIEKKRQIEAERETSNKLKTIEIYDYSDEEADNLVNRIIRSLQLLLVVARCLPNFEHSMKKADKDAFVDAIYSMPNKIFSAWAEIMDTEIDDLIAFFKEQSKDYYGRQKVVTDSDIIKALQWAAMSFLLDLYNLPVFFATKEHTIQYLNGFDYHAKNTYELEHLMMMERQSSSKAFSEEAIRLIDDKKGHIYSTMLARVIGHALVFKKELELPQRQQLQSKFFPGADNQRKLLVQRMKNQGKDE